MFFPGSSDATDFVPWCTYTDPELAHAGLTAAEAARAARPDDVHVWTHDLSHSDRARADSAADGEIRVVTHKGRIVGAHALTPNAGEVIHELALAISEGKKLSDLGGLVHVYPTLSVGIGQLAGEAAYERAGQAGLPGAVQGLGPPHRRAATHRLGYPRRTVRARSTVNPAATSSGRVSIGRIPGTAAATALSRGAPGARANGVTQTSRPPGASTRRASARTGPGSSRCNR